MFFLIHSLGEGEMAEEDDGEAEKNVKREKPVVRPEEIPPVPENRFLLRRDMPSQEETIETLVSFVQFNKQMFLFAFKHHKNLSSPSPVIR